MALRFTDGFDSYAATNDLFKKWGNVVTPFSWSSSDGVVGGGSVSCGASGGGILSSPTGILNSTSIALAFRFKSSTAGTPSHGFGSSFFNVLTSSGATNFLAALSLGKLSFLTGGLGTIASGNINICDGNYHWIEIKAGSSGSFTGLQCYVDGVLDASSSSAVTAGTMSYIQFVSNSVVAFTIDDVIAYDDVGNAPVFANFPLGQQVIKTIRPTSDGTCTFGTVSSGTNHSAMVDEVAGDTTDYVEDGTSGHQDLYNYGSVGSPTSIVGAMLNSYMHNPGAGAINANGVCKSGATTSVGGTVALSAGPKTYQQEYGVDPNTSAAWTAANINSAQFGAKVA